MLELILILLYVGALIAAAVYAFVQPRGVYWRSALGFGAVVVLAAAVWWLGSPFIAQEAGLGAFAIWLAISCLAALVALAACAGATLRHLLNAFGARMI